MANARSSFDALRETLSREHEATIGLYYGKPAALIGELAFICFHHNACAFRLHGRAREHALTIPGARRFDPLKPDATDSGDWVMVGAANAYKWEKLALEALQCTKEREIAGKKADADPPGLPDPDAREEKGASFAERYQAAKGKKSDWKVSKKEPG